MINDRQSLAPHMCFWSLWMQHRENGAFPLEIFTLWWLFLVNVKISGLMGTSCCLNLSHSLCDTESLRFLHMHKKKKSTFQNPQQYCSRRHISILKKRQLQGFERNLIDTWQQCMHFPYQKVCGNTFIVALFIIAKIWTKPKSISTVELIN